MTNEHNFKKGDRVRLKGDDAFIGTIVDVGLYSADIIWDCDPNEIYLQAFDCIEHIDRRTAFLTELQALLRKYDARIYDEDEYKVIIDLGIHSNKGERIECMGTDGEVTADNIMDFDKEGTPKPAKE